MQVEFEKINIIAENKNVLVGYLKEFSRLLDIDLAENSELKIWGDCGCEVSYKNFDDIPETNVICKHGNKLLIYSQLN